MLSLIPYLVGRKRRSVALARAMMIDPVIGYDETTSALDPELRLEVEKLIHKIVN